MYGICGVTAAFPDAPLAGRSGTAGVRCWMRRHLYDGFHCIPTEIPMFPWVPIKTDVSEKNPLCPNARQRGCCVQIRDALPATCAKHPHIQLVSSSSFWLASASMQSIEFAATRAIAAFWRASHAAHFARHTAMSASSQSWTEKSTSAATALS